MRERCRLPPRYAREKPTHSSRMKAFSELLGHLSALLDNETITPQAAALRMAQYIQGRIACSRVSVWAVEGDAGERCMRRIAGFDADTQAALTEPAALGVDQFAGCLSALTTQGVYICPDALADPHMAAMKDSYLLPNDIRASLDAAVSVNGDIWGMVCCAQKGAPRDWSPHEVRLVKRFADEISLRRARRRRREADATSVMRSLMRTHLLPTDTPTS